jgi:hypothetical protein
VPQDSEVSSLLLALKEKIKPGKEDPGRDKILNSTILLSQSM